MGKAFMFAMVGAVGLGMGTYQIAQAEDRDGKEGKERKQGKMEITGPVTSLTGTCPNLQFTVAQQQVATKDKTEFEDVSCTELTDGMVVEVKGWVKDGVLMAREVEAENDDD